MPRKVHIPTETQRSETIAYAMVGVPHHDIAKLIGINTRTLRKYYQHELDLGKARANAQMGGKLWRTAMNGNVAAQIFWMKAQAGWREVQRVEQTGPDGQPIAITQNHALELTDAELLDIAKRGRPRTTRKAPVEG